MKAPALLFVVALFLSGIGYTYYVHRQITKVGVVDIVKVTSKFQLKKELQSKVEAALNEYSNRIDSLNAVLEYTRTSHPEKVGIYEKQLSELKEEAQNMYTISGRSITEQVWKRLNPIIQAYGKEKGYRMILGANGNGGVLYAESASADITEDIIKYVNRNYAGGK